MAFGNYRSLGEVALAYNVSIKFANFLQPLPFPVSDHFASELKFTLEHIDVYVSEQALCEFVIAPVLREVWKAYCDTLQLWSHVSFGTEEPLLGVPDYFFSRRSPLGPVVDQPPFVLFVEAKKDDFEAGWGQCLAAMLAAQMMNGQPPRTIYGCVSNGDLWRFGKLQGQEFLREIRGFVPWDLPNLFAAWNYVFAQAKEQALAPAA